MFLQSLDLTTALRPSLVEDETLLFVQDAVGLYEGCEMLPHITRTSLMDHFEMLRADKCLHSANTKFLTFKTAMPISLLIESALSIMWNLEKIYLP